jgi:NAD(P)-dependent dehydrogenase (short-subunit alcohol dehydrogenase family)
MDFNSKVAIVTGAGGKLGRAIASGLSAGGADVLITDFKQELLDETATILRENAKGRVETFATDISAHVNCVALVDAAVNAFGRLDIIVNNAGMIMISPLANVQAPEWERIFAVNVHAPIFIIQAAMPHLLKTGGNVVNVCSNSAFKGHAYMAAYSASKAALVNATMSLTMEFIHEPVRLNCVAPGAINTNMASNTSFPEGATIDFELLKRTTPLRPFSEPEQIAEVVLFLASERASAVRGSCFTVDQGVLAG